MRKKIRGSPSGAGRKDVALMQPGVTGVPRSLGFFAERARSRRSAPGGSGERCWEPIAQRITVSGAAGGPAGEPAQPRTARDVSDSRRRHEERRKSRGHNIGDSS